MNRYPLYNALQHHDACGVGFIADRNTVASHRIVRLGVQCLHALDHRGARSADGTGDGAGVMTRVPYRLVERELKARGIDLPGRDRTGVVMAFLPKASVEASHQIVGDALEANGIRLLTWRPVPTNPNILSETAAASLPIIEQAIVQAGTTIPNQDAFEKALFLARKQIERTESGDGFAIVSASARTVVYKGLFTADTIEQFYWDLRDPFFESDFVIFHQRYSRTQSRRGHLPSHFGCLPTTVRSTRCKATGRGWWQDRMISGMGCGVNAPRILPHWFAPA